MASIILSKARLDLPTYSVQSRSLKSKILSKSTGGYLSLDDQSVVVNALREIDLHVGDSERIGIIGSNGSGKSTLLRLLGRIYFPTSGCAKIQGDVVSLIDITLGMDNEATGRENIFLRGALLGFSRKEISKKVDEIIGFSELDHFIDLPIRTYSSGMQLRLAFSVSTLVQPQILLMDEWLAVGDEEFQRKAESRLSEVMRKTNILVIASHSRDLIMKTCNRVLWLEHGMIKMDGAPDEVCAAYFG